MLLKIWLANIVLAAAVFFVGVKTVGVWTEKRVFKNSSAQKSLTWQEKNGAKRMMPPESEYQVIVSDNLFFADRSEGQQEEPKQGPAIIQKAGGSRLKILEQVVKHTNLYGVIIVDDRREAFIGEIPARKPIRIGEEGIKRAKVGDTVGIFKVKQINNRSVLLTAEGHEWQISLFDKDKPKKRVPVKKETGPIVVGAGSKPMVGGPSEEAKAKEKLPVPATAKKDIFEKGQDTKKNLPVPDGSGPEKR
ncbi:MAG: hypothetical protein ABII26_10240 [Pseudomonadota bacterium]